MVLALSVWISVVPTMVPEGPAMVAAVPRPRLVRAVAPDSATQVEPFPTAKLPSVTARPARADRLSPARGTHRVPSHL